MANRHRGEVSLEVGDETYTLVFSLNELCELEDRFGTNSFPELEERLNNLGARDVRTMIWAALQEHHPEMTEKDAAKIAKKAGLTEVLEKVGEALRLAFPEQDQVQGGSGSERPTKAKARSH